MKSPPPIRVMAACALALASPLSLSAATWTVAPSGGDFTTLSAAVLSVGVGNGDTINVAAGSYGNGDGLGAPTTAQRQTLTIAKQLTIVGAGMGQTIITHTSAPGTDTPCVNITAANVTLKDLTVSYGNGEGATIYRGSGVQTNQANTTIENVAFDINYARRGIFVNSGTTNTTIRGCDFSGEMNREAIDINNNTALTPGTLTIENNVFRQHHYQQGSILFDGASGQNAVIRNNFFVSRVGVLSATNTMPDANYGFQGDGTLLYNIYVGTLTAGRTVLIDNNTFVFQDAVTLNRSGTVPAMQAIEMVSTADHGATGAPVTITDNIFQGYRSEKTAQAVPYSFVASGGVFGNALSLDGAFGLGEFLATSAFNVGAKGTLSVWVKLTDTARRNQILEGPNDSGLEFQYRSNSGGQFFARPYGGSEFVIQSGAAATTNWVLVQYTWDQTSATARIYSGNQSTAVAESAYLVSNDQNISGWASPVDTTSGTILLGEDAGDSTRRFGGLMDDLAIYNDVLTPAELESIRTGGSVALAGDPRQVAHWTFDETSGSTAASEVNNLTINLEDARSALLSYVIASGATPTVNNNLYFGNETVYLQATTDADQVLGNPLFVGSGATTRDFYQVAAGSPAIAADSTGGTIGAAQYIAPPDTAPTIDVNQTLNVALGSSATITPATLSASDAEQAASALTYTVTSAPTRGSLSLSTFTQQDINNGLVVYTSAGTGVSDSFGFSLSDGVNAAVTGTVNVAFFGGADADRDGLPNSFEAVLGTNPNSKDSDGDTIEDGVEVAIGWNPLVAAALVDQADVDGDKLPDTWEAANGFNAANPDQDGDRFLDGYEVAINGYAALTGTPALGEVNGTAPVNNQDAIALLELFLGVGIASVGDEQLDVSRNGSVDNVDAVILYQWVLGNVDYLPFQ